MAGADGIHVMLFEQQQIAFHDVQCERAAEVGVEFMAVDAAEHDRHSVHQQIAFFDLHGAESEFQRFVFDRSGFVFQRQHQRVEGRRFSGPGGDLFHLGGKFDFDVFPRFDLGDRGGQGLFEDRIADGIEKFRVHTQCFRGNRIGVDDFRFHFQLAVFVSGIESGFGKDVVDVLLRDRADGNIAEDPAQPPHVLVFQIRAVAPLQDLDGDPVGAELGDVGDVKLGSIAAAFAHAGELSVDPDVIEGIHAVEFQQDALFGPVVFDLEFADIAAGGIIRRHERRVKRERVDLISIVRIAVTFHLPVAGDHDIVPFTAVEIFPEKVFRSLRRRVEIGEFPGTVQQFVERGKRIVAEHGLVFGFKRDRICPIRLFVDRGQSLIFPIVHLVYPYAG